MRRIVLILSLLACADRSEPTTVPNTLFSETDTRIGQVIITEDADERAVKALHERLIEAHDYGEAICVV